MTDLIDVALLVVDALEHTDVPYTIGGSLASSFSGEPRASLDADILVDMRAEQIDPFINSLRPEFYVDRDSLARAVVRRASTNVVHRPTAIKVDLFVAGTVLDAHQLKRRRLIQIAANPVRAAYVHSPEDILLQKLHWYRLGGEVSERQWRDALAILLVQGPRLDREYLAGVAGEAGLADLLSRAYDEAGRRA